MRLFELLNAVTPSDVKGNARRLDECVYSQRIIQSAGAVKISPPDIEQLLHRARLDPKF